VNQHYIPQPKAAYGRFLKLHSHQLVMAFFILALHLMIPAALRLLKVQVELTVGLGESRCSIFVPTIA
jgi:hypothetical protein